MYFLALAQTSFDLRDFRRPDREQGPNEGRVHEPDDRGEKQATMRQSCCLGSSRGDHRPCLQFDQRLAPLVQRPAPFPHHQNEQQPTDDRGEHPRSRGVQCRSSVYLLGGAESEPHDLDVMSVARCHFSTAFGKMLCVHNAEQVGSVPAILGCISCLPPKEGNISPDHRVPVSNTPPRCRPVARSGSAKGTEFQKPYPSLSLAPISFSVGPRAIHAAFAAI